MKKFRIIQIKYKYYIQQSRKKSFFKREWVFLNNDGLYVDSVERADFWVSFENAKTEKERLESSFKIFQD